MNEYITLAFFPFALVHFAYVLSITKKNFGLIDIFWGAGIGSFALAALLFGENVGPRLVLISLLVLIWATRLSVFLYKRNMGHKEDYRYADMRKSWGKQANAIAYGKIFLLQFFLMLVISLPVWIVFREKGPAFHWPDYLGFILWAVGITWEAIADKQKSQFKKENPEGVCDIGLWSLSRHPNYFGESLLWWGIALVSFGTGNALGFISPAILTFSLLKVSGIPLIEKRHANDPKYQDYMKNTPKFIPSISKMLKARG